MPTMAIGPSGIFEQLLMNCKSETKWTENLLQVNESNLIEIIASELVIENQSNCRTMFSMLNGNAAAMVHVFTN
jgi:hypothetical protein